MVMPIVSQSRPSYGEGFARGSLSKRPNLWKGLVGCWETTLGATGLTLRDVSGYHNHGAFVNMGISNWLVDINGYTINYNGSTPSVLIPYKTSLEHEEYTFVFKITPDSVTGNHHVFGQWGPTLFSTTFRTNGQNFEIFHNDGVGNDSVTTTTANLSIGVGSTIIVVYSGGTSGTNLLLYHNGILVKSGTIIKVPQAITGNYTIGRTGSNTLAFDGLIGKGLFYNRALFAKEIQDIYQYPNAMFEFADQRIWRAPAVGGGRIMGSLAGHGGLAGYGGIAGQRGGLAG